MFVDGRSGRRGIEHWQITNGSSSTGEHTSVNMAHAQVRGGLLNRPIVVDLADVNAQGSVQSSVASVPEQNRLNERSFVADADVEEVVSMEGGSGTGTTWG